MIIRWKPILCVLAYFLSVSYPLISMAAETTGQSEHSSTEIDITHSYEFDGEKLSIPAASKIADTILNSVKGYERRSRRQDITGMDFLVKIKMPEHGERKRTIGTSGAHSYDKQLRDVNNEETLEKLLKRSTFNTDEPEQFKKIVEDAITHITSFKVTQNNQTGNKLLLIVSTLPEAIGKTHDLQKTVTIEEANREGAGVYSNTHTVAMCLGLGHATGMHDLSTARVLSLYPINPDDHAFKCSVQEVVEEK